MSKQNYTDVLLEDINGKFDVILEIVQGMQEQLARKVDKTDLAILYEKISVIEYSVKQLVLKNKQHETHHS